MSEFADLRSKGASARQAARAVGKSDAWASAQDVVVLARPSLDSEAERALADFEFFRRAYLGHPSMPWQVEAAQVLIAAWDSPDRRYVVMNCPSGAGKSTLLVDFAAWLTVRARWADRVLRGLLGSYVASNADRSLGLLRRTLERTEPPIADPDNERRGVEVQAWRCLAADFGSFRPLSREVPWKAVGFEVQYYDGFVPNVKEPTWSSYGQNSGVLSNRFNAALWDDLATTESCATPGAIAKQRGLWDTDLESRLEPGGLMADVGQRIAAGDLHRHCLDKTALDDDDREVPKYQHVVFPAHFDDLCQGNHDKATAREWPYGCLLDPHRLPWKGQGGLEQIRRNNPQAFEVWYQQRDGDPEGGLVRDVWLTGGVDHHAEGAVVPGCFDRDRVYGVVPKEFRKGAVRAATVDPSAAKHWAVQDWVATTDLRVLIDSFDGRMTADELLDWDHTMGEFKGIMHRWQQRSIEQGLPIRTWIIERNAAQRYLLAYDHVRRWCEKHNVTIWPHDTTAKNKLDVELGPTVLREPHRTGMFRYAYGDLASVKKTEVIRQQLTTFPNPAFRSDQVMAAWFFAYRLPALQPSTRSLPLLPRPTWQRRRSA